MMLERINTLSAEIGDHLFIRYNGAVRECVLRGYKIYDYDYNDAIIYFGKEIGEKAIHIFDYNFYYGIDNALKTDGEKVEILSYTIEEFHAKYFSQTSLFFDGHCFVGYLWQKADCEPGLYRTKEDISYAEVRENNDIRYFLKDGKRLSIASRWFSTKEACFEANKPKVIMLDE